jgi:hypothetical protein
MKHTIMEAVMTAAMDPTSFPQIEPDLVLESRIRHMREMAALREYTDTLPDDDVPDNEVVRSRWDTQCPHPKERMRTRAYKHRTYYQCGVCMMPLEKK